MNNASKYTLRYVLKWITFQLRKKLYPFYKREWIVLYRYTKALGDNLFLGSVAHEIRKRNPKCSIHIITGLPMLFDRNPDVDFVSGEPLRPNEAIGPYLLHYENMFPWKKNIVDYCFRQFDMKNVKPDEYKTYIYPSSKDFDFATNSLLKTKGRKVVAISTIAGPRTKKKNWPIEYWNHLIESLLEFDIYVVKLGLNYKECEDLSVKSENILDLTGRTTIHQSAAILSKVDLLICPVTGVLHLAAAFNIKTLAIVGGSEPGIATKYENGFYIENRPKCADCYEKGPCEYKYVCMKSISPKEVFSRVSSIIELKSIN